MTKVWLLYEGDEWLSTGSLVLMAICTSEESFRANAEKLIAERAAQHFRTAKGNGMDFDCKEGVCEDISLELRSRGATTGWDVNYCYTIADCDQLGEI